MVGNGSKIPAGHAQGVDIAGVCQITKNVVQDLIWQLANRCHGTMRGARRTHREEDEVSNIVGTRSMKMWDKLLEESNVVVDGERKEDERKRTRRSQLVWGERLK